MAAMGPVGLQWRIDGTVHGPIAEACFIGNGVDARYVLVLPRGQYGVAALARDYTGCCESSARSQPAVWKPMCWRVDGA